MIIRNTKSAFVPFPVHHVRDGPHILVAVFKKKFGPPSKTLGCDFFTLHHSTISFCALWESKRFQRYVGISESHSEFSAAATVKDRKFEKEQLASDTEKEKEDIQKVAEQL
jgi:hypothetical protein